MAARLRSLSLENLIKNIQKYLIKQGSLLSEEIIHFGFVESKSDYYHLLNQSDIVPVTSNQDFFGISAIEAIAAGCVPLLPKPIGISRTFR